MGTQRQQILEPREHGSIGRLENGMAARSKLLPHQEVVAEKMGFVRGRKEIKRRRVLSGSRMFPRVAQTGR